MKRRILAIALTLCMLFSLLPVSALAAETYALYINNFQFTSSNLTYTSGSGSATYNPTSKTLTIKNLSLSTGAVNTIIESGISGLTIKIDGTLTLNLLASKVVDGVDYGKVRTNYGIAVTADTTICGANNSADKDSIIITSQSVGVDDTEYSDGTTRVGIRPISGAKLTMKNLTVSMTDNSTGSYAGHASMIRAVAALNISGCKLVTDKCQFGVFVDAYSPVTITDTVFDMNLNGEKSSGVNFAPNAVNVMQNCSGYISGQYPVYTAGPLTISGGSKLTLVASDMGMIAAQNQNQTPGKLILDNVNVEIQSEKNGFDAEAGGSITMKSGTVTMTKATYGVQVKENSSFALQGGTLTIRGANTTNCVGIKNSGTVTVTGGSLKTENVYTAIQNTSSTALSVTGGEHTLTAATCGYLGDSSSELKISNTAKVTLNAETGIRLSASSNSKLTVSGGELNVNATNRGIELPDSSSAMTLSGGKVNITDKNSTPTIYGIYSVGNTQLTGAEVTFKNCRYDILVANANSKMTGGKLHLAGYVFGTQFPFGFEMTGGTIDGSAYAYGIIAAQGTTTLKGGTVNLSAKYPFYVTNGGTLDFAGANVTGKSTSDCGLLVDTDTEGNSYKISGGTVVLTSSHAGASAMYTSMPSNYGVWAGADEASATLVAAPTEIILTNSKYVRFAEKKAVTLTLVNVKEGTSASYLPGEAFTYTAKDAPNNQHFSHWELTVNGTTTNVGTGTTYSGKMPAGNATLTAVYENCSGGTADCQHLAVCSVCGKEYGILGAHRFTEEVEDEKYVITPPTCEGEGTYYKSCSVCGASAENWVNATFTVPALGHAWGDWTSNGNGTHSRICGNNADHNDTEDCSGGTATCQQKAVCDICKAEYGELAAHSYTAEVAEDAYLKDAATCTEAAVYYKSCTACGASSKGTAFEATFSHGEAKGHAWGEWTSNGDGTHSRICGNDAEHKETKACSGGTADCTHGPFCDFCHAEYGAPGDHSYTAEVAEDQYLKSAATCTEAAVYYKSCTGCGASSEGTEFEATFSYGEPLKHLWSDWASNGDGTHSRTCSRDKDHNETEACSGGTATCQQKAVCEFCHAEYGELAAHDYTAEAAEDAYLKDAATCTEAATYYKSCAVCGASSKDTEFEATFSHGKALGHQWGEWTSNGDGTHSRTCSRDKDHNETVACSGGTATCLKEAVCDFCHETYGEVDDSHEYEPCQMVHHEYIKSEPTCTEAAVFYKCCAFCGASSQGTEYEETFTAGTPLGHDVKYGPTIKEPTCVEHGLAEYSYCARCNEVLQERALLNLAAHTLVEDAETETLTKGLHCSVCGEVLLAQFSKAGGRWTDDGNYDAALYASEPGNWVISDAADLAALAKKVNDGNTFEGFTVTLTADIDLSAHLWIPIGWYNYYNPKPFCGTFRGGLHTISGMRIYLDINADNWEAAGLFGLVRGGEITDLQVSGDVLVLLKYRSYCRIGGLAGFVDNSTLRNCGFVGTAHTDGRIRFYTDAVTGGLVGSAEQSTVENCYAIANVSTMNVDDSAHTGGLFGKADSNVHASNCYAVAAVTQKNINTVTARYGTFEGGQYTSTANNCYTQIASVGPNGNATVLTRGQMQSADGLVTLLNAYVSENGNGKDRAWYVDPAENQGYPTFGLTVRFETGIEGEEATVVGVKSGSTVTPADGEIPGYSFQGWFADEARTVAFDFSKPITADTTVYGKYVPIFSITYVLNGGENAADNPTEYVYGVGAALADATRENYLFEGWYTDYALTQRITEIGTEQTGSLTLYAKWSLDPNHTHAYGACRVGENGLHERVCELCGKVEPATYTTTVTEPTCTKMGFTTYTCSHCTRSHTSDYIAPIGHDWNEGKVVSAPTLTDTGILVQTCGTCGETKETIIPMLTACDGGSGCPSKAYVDVPGESHWAHVGIDFVLKSGLFYGTSETTFAPNATMTRAMLVTVLYRLEGMPETEAENPFEDIADGKWYTDAVVWAAENGIVTGVKDSIFNPNGEITREQMATVLYRYTKFKGLTLNDSGYVEEYPDADKVSPYAVEAMRWANAEGLVNGMRNGKIVTLSPKGNATRAQVATIFMRYVQNVLTK